MEFDLSAWLELQKRLDDYCFKHNLSYQIYCKTNGKWGFSAYFHANPIVRIKDVDNLFSALYYGVNALKNKFGGNYEIEVNYSDIEENNDVID